MRVYRKNQHEREYLVLITNNETNTKNDVLELQILWLGMKRILSGELYVLSRVMEPISTDN